jgi:RsiW-degrading membrane proteinase PrsW (M82 family)
MIINTKSGLGNSIMLISAIFIIMGILSYYWESPDNKHHSWKTFIFSFLLIIGCIIMIVYSTL